QPLLVLSSAAIALSLLNPKQYQKQLTLSVQSTFIPLSSQPLPFIDINQAGALTVDFLGSSQLEEITVTARYDIETRKIGLNLQSPSAKALDAVAPKIVSQLKTKFQEPLNQSLTISLTTTELQLEKEKSILPELQRTIAQLPPTDRGKLDALEAEQAQAAADIAALEFDKDYLEQSQKNLPEFTAKIMSVQVVSESEVQETRPSGQMAVIAVIASFMVAVLAAIICDQVARIKNDLSQPNN
ncbi:MAG: hypothetical protein F6K28_30885, partial [Microcoleus sp. SIO2G3]|nr:hypothetical protein [Microcoleus sp. SIO2G3]